MDVKQATWNLIRRDPELAAWVKDDPEFQHLLAQMVSLFGVVETERDDEQKQSGRNRTASIRVSAWFSSQGYRPGSRTRTKGRS